MHNRSVTSRCPQLPAMPADAIQHGRLAQVLGLPVLSAVRGMDQRAVPANPEVTSLAEHGMSGSKVDAAHLSVPPRAAIQAVQHRASIPHRPEFPASRGDRVQSMLRSASQCFPMFPAVRGMEYQSVVTGHPKLSAGSGNGEQAGVRAAILFVPALAAVRAMQDDS